MAELDPEGHRADARERWEAIAAGWASGGDVFQAATLPVAHWMVERLRPQPGETVLELAAGRGDVGFLAAELLQPGGKLISTDGAEAMVAEAERHAAALGVTGEVEFKPMELEWVDARTATLDGVLSRFGYNHAVDPEAALREARRVLKPGGRIALATWAAPADNVWLAALPEEAQRMGLAEPPPAGTPGAFALSDPDALGELLEDAGFDEVVIEPIELTFAAPDLDALWSTIRDMSSTMRPILDGLAPADHYNLRDAVEARWQPYVGADGSVAVPGRALGAAAEA